MYSYSAIAKMDEFRELFSFGEKLGYTGDKLKEFVTKEVHCLETKHENDRQREERVRKRDIAREKEKEAHELEVLRYKKELAEKTPTTAQPSTSGWQSSSLKMPAFEDNRDHMDSYLERFERFATSNKWAKFDWAIRLSALLRGKSLEVYSRMSQEEASDYDKLKLALLKTYNMTEEGYRTRFLTSRPMKQESPCQYAARISGYLLKCIRNH